MDTLPERHHICPQCKGQAMLVTDIDNDLPVLSPSHTPVYYCTHCRSQVWEGMHDLLKDGMPGKDIK